MEGITDQELRQECLRNNINVGPITPTTRKIYEKKLAAVMSGNRAIDTPDYSALPQQVEPPDFEIEEDSAYEDQESDTDYHGEESSRLLSPEESFRLRERLTPPRRFSTDSAARYAAANDQGWKGNKAIFMAVLFLVVFLVCFFIFLSENAAKYKPKTDDL